MLAVAHTHTLPPSRGDTNILKIIKSAPALAADHMLESDPADPKRQAG